MRAFFYFSFQAFVQLFYGVVNAHETVGQNERNPNDEDKETILCECDSALKNRGVKDVMAQVDLAGSVVPARYTQGRMATVAVNEFIFKQPVRVGDILSFFSAVTRIGRTSITVKVEVYAERYNTQGNYIKVTEALVTYVAIDDQGKPREIPKTAK